MMTRLRHIAVMLALALQAVLTAEDAEPPSAAGDAFAYLPPAFAQRVVFYHSFEQGVDAPEINLIDASVAGKVTESATGITGKGYRCPTAKKEERYSVQSSQLCPDRPLTVMVWWRLDQPMVMTSGFNVLTLHGKGLIGSFVRGKGSWCALPEPRRVFQAYYFDGIANRNDTYSERILITEPSWHHTAITVAGASDITVYWDGKEKTSYSTRGRPFEAGDVNQLCAGLRYGSHPMTIDDVVVLDLVLDASALKHYVNSVRQLADVGFPTVVPVAGQSH